MLATISLEEILKESNLISHSELTGVVDESSKFDKTIFDLIIEKKIIREVELLSLLAPYFGFVFEELDKATVDYRVSRFIPESFARANIVIPMFQLGEYLTVAISTPFNNDLVEEIELITKMSVNVILSPQKNIEDLFSHCYAYRDQHSDEPTSLGNLFEMGMKLIDERRGGEEENLDLAHEAPIAKLVDSVINQAITEHASDIHIEPEETDLKIRFRIDGLMKEIMAPPKKLESAIISRIKILANLDITETRKPQDGRLTVTYKDKDIDFRVSTVRTISGEKIVMRVLDKSGAFVSLDKLGLSMINLKGLQTLISSTSGIIIVCGPTGSGKTSTLYSALSYINTPDKNIITIEDPVEFNLDGINQIPVNHKIGVDFITGLKAILRQDPDVIMVGEVRDYETANIAIQAALTGHLVFTTLHTRNASGAITRLTDMGVQPFLLNSSVLGVLGQRLARGICQNCKEVVSPDIYKSIKQIELIKDVLQKNKEAKFFKGAGCKFCDGTGYKGRTGIFEILVLNEEIRELIVSKASSEKIQRVAVEMGMVIMKDDGIHKIMNGLTTVEEIARILDV